MTKSHQNVKKYFNKKYPSLYKILGGMLRTVIYVFAIRDYGTAFLIQDLRVYNNLHIYI